MKFELEFPDSCYNEDKKHYDMFAAALQQMLNRMAASHNKYQRGLPMNETVAAHDELTSSRQRVAMYSSTPAEWGVLCNCGREPNSLHFSNCFLMQKELNTGNTENLLDGANMLIIESILPKHPKAHFRAQASHESPGVEYLP